MEIINLEYDRIHFELVGEDLVAHDNIVVEESLSEADDLALSSVGYIIRRIDDTNYWVISGRLHDAGMMAGIEALHTQFASA